MIEQPCGSDELATNPRLTGAARVGQGVPAGSRLRGLLDDLLLFLFLAFLAVLFAGCCWFSKRSCFPACPPPTKVVVEVEKTCEMPPAVVLDAVKRAECSTEPTWACYAPQEAGKLARNLAVMKTWIRETRARCGPRAASQPSSQPASRPAPDPQ